jgi:sugar-specific transcriptional regulator TrmB
VLDFSPEDRALFETEGAALYEAVVAQGGLPADDPDVAPGGAAHRAFELLVRIGLLIEDPHDGSYAAVDPTTVQSRIVSPLSHEGAQLLAESSQWATAFGALAQTWRRSPGATRGPITELRGDAIDSFIAAMVGDAESELLTAQPQTGRDAPTLAAAAGRDVAALERGLRMRTLYQHSARRSSITHKYVAAVTARGAEVRTLDEFFNRLIVVDRRIAVIPSYEGLDAALAIREPSLVAYLVDMFERSWERARPFTNRESTMMRHVAAEQRAMTMRMLIEGHADPTSAKRLGVSPRTYAGYVAELKDQYEAQTRFQLGYAMGREGASGQEAFED